MCRLIGELQSRVIQNVDSALKCINYNTVSIISDSCVAIKCLLNLAQSFNLWCEKKLIKMFTLCNTIYEYTLTTLIRCRLILFDFISRHIILLYDYYYCIIRYASASRVLYCTVLFTHIHSVVPLHTYNIMYR